MEKLAIKFNATISRYWNPSVTHVIASTNEKGACTRTLKVLMGVLNGKWIINSDCKLDSSPQKSFIFFFFCKENLLSLHVLNLDLFLGMKASIEAFQPVDEEPFEIHLDTQGCQDGPKTARLSAATNVSIKIYEIQFESIKFVYLTLYFLC